MVSRRAFLIGAGGLACVAIGTGAWISTRDIDLAQEPWRAAAGDFDDPRMHALAHAILAPNPHNRQPWLIELVGADSLVLWPDTGRFLPHTDPPNRQVTIGFGAFLEVLRQAATASGHRARTTLFPQGSDPQRLDRRPIAEVVFERDALPADPLAGSILSRRTNRQPFDPERPVPEKTLVAIAARADAANRLAWTSAGADVAALTALNRRAWTIEFETPAAHEESTALTRIGAGEVNHQPDGISLHGPIIELAALTGSFTRSAMRDDASFASGQAREFYDKLLQATATYAWLTSPDNSRESQIMAGRDWVRVNQAANDAGVSFHPVSQALQEFPEMAAPFGELHQRLKVAKPRRIQGLFRLGYASQPEPAPRWPLATRMIDERR